MYCLDSWYQISVHWCCVERLNQLWDQGTDTKQKSSTIQFANSEFWIVNYLPFVLLHSTPCALFTILPPSSIVWQLGLCSRHHVLQPLFLSWCQWVSQFLHSALSVIPGLVEMMLCSVGALCTIHGSSALCIGVAVDIAGIYLHLHKACHYKLLTTIR